jgi:hypothetical protein
MKNILCVIIIVAGAFVAHSQERPLTQAQFDAIYLNSFEVWSLESWKGKSYRKITITHSSTEGRPQTDYSSKSTFEYASPTVSRSVYETSFGDKKSKTESIRQGEKIYTRKDGESWKEGVFTAKSRTAKTPSVADSADSQIEYKFLGSESLNNQAADVYAKIVKTKRLEPSGSQEEKITTSTTKYWFSKEGFLLKLDMVMESCTGEKTVRTLLTQSWEFDENIKIDAADVKRSE